MARLERKAEFQSSLQVKEVSERLVSYFVSLGARITTLSETYLEARTGSQVGTRFKGGIIARTSEYPMRTSVHIRGQANGSAVDVTVVDELGIGFKVGMKNKYQRAFEERLSGIEASLR